MATFFDIVILAVAVVLGFVGAMSGLIRGVFRFGAMFAGFVIAFMFYRDLEDFLVSLTSSASGNASAIVAFLLVFAAVSFAVLGIGRLLHEIVKSVSLGWLDRLLGFALGLLMGCIVIWAVCLSISSMPLEVVQKEFSGSVVYKAYGSMPKFFSLDGMEDFRDKIRGTKRKTRNNAPADDTKGGSNSGDDPHEEFDCPLKKKMNKKKKAPKNKDGAVDI